jgi:hypothetical protein
MSIDESAKKRESANGFITDEDQDGGNATEQKSTPGDALAGSPGSDNDDSTLQYNAERHSFNGPGASTEASPSTGWRQVYAAMEVDDGKIK